MLKGIIASEGIGIGKAFIVKNLDTEFIKERNITENEVESELDKLQYAIKTVKNELIFLKERAEKEFSQEAKDILSAQVMILDDPLFLGEVIDIIKGERLDAIGSYARVMKKFVLLFKKMKDEYFRDRAEDIKDVGERVISALQGTYNTEIFHSEDEIVLVGKQVGISDLMKFDKGKISGICIESSGRTSHIAIFSKTLEIPMIVVLENVTDSITHGQEIILDWISGEVFINFDK
jgi:phosphotransferase system enzyme I (PtsI)